MLNKPRISVVMPVYNTREEYLREAIESILNQTYRNFEFIIINDGSTNNAEEVILSYKDERIKYIKQENIGLAKTLNKGFEIAACEYIARMDSDDISLPERFEKQVQFLDKHTDYSICGTSFEMFPETHIIKHTENPKICDFIHHCCIGHPTVMLRKADLKNFDLKYNPEFLCEDYELWSRAIKHLKFYNLQEVLLKYRWHGENLSIATPKFQKDVDKVKQNLLDFLSSDKDFQKQIQALIAPPPKKRTNIIQYIFSLKNETKYNKKWKVITILGIKFKIKKKG